MKPRRSALILFTLLACNARDISKPDDPGPQAESKKIMQVSTERLLDVLFVVDNSDSMKEEQTSLAENFKAFMNVLSAIDGGLPSVHIGVVSSDVGVGTDLEEQCRALGDDGLLQNQARSVCTPPLAGARFIEDVVNGDNRQKNYTGSLDETFKCIAELGTGGCGYEQHLEAMKLALDGSRPENGGFLRRDAYLAVVILADEDDCSARIFGVFDPSGNTLNGFLGPSTFRCTEYGLVCDGAPPARVSAAYQSCVPQEDSYLRHPARYVDFLRSLKADPSLLVTAVIAGNTNKLETELTDATLKMKNSCSSENGFAYPAVRLEYFADQFGDHGTFVSICQKDLTDALTQVAELLAKTISTNCLDATVVTDDIDPVAPGVQLECAVADLRFGTETPLPRCLMRDATTPEPMAQPCWWAAPEPKCDDASGLALHVERAEDAPAGTQISVRCRAGE